MPVILSDFRKMGGRVIRGTYKATGLEKASASSEEKVANDIRKWMRRKYGGLLVFKIRVE